MKHLFSVQGQTLVLFGCLAPIAGCQHPRSLAAEDTEEPKLRITPTISMVWQGNERATINVSIANSEAINICVPTLAKTEAGSVIELHTAAGRVLRPDLTEDIIPRSRVEVDNLAPAQRVKFEIVLGYRFQDDDGHDFLVRYRTVGVQCNEGDASVKFPLSSDHKLVLVDSGVHQFSRP